MRHVRSTTKSARAQANRGAHQGFTPWPRAAAFLVAFWCCVRGAEGAVPPGCNMTGGTLTSCAGFNGAYLDLINSSLTAIAPGAFDACTQLTTLYGRARMVISVYVCA